ncbi:MAG: YceI family protein [Flavobacteriaceae bacterium]
MRMIKSVAILLFTGFAMSLSAQTKAVNTQKSMLNWKGYKVVGLHEGTINLKEGNLIFEKDKLKGGSFTVDMTSISSTDMSGKGKERLDGHLKNQDFFDVENHPESTLVFKKVSEKSKGNYTIEADLTIKGIKKPITFTLEIKDNTATALVQIDRTQYDIKYRSASLFPDLADKAIKDEFDINATLVF